MDEETQQFIQVRKIKLERLRVLDQQAAAYGPYATPPHIEMERTTLREELGMVEQAIQSPARASIGDELGASGRFLVYVQQNREIKQSIAALAVDLERFVTASEEWRSMHRQILIVIGIAVILIVIAVASIITYILTRGGL